MENKRAWIYCRVEPPDAHMLTIQQSFLEELAKRRGFEIVGITAEHASGLDFHRRGLSEVSSAVAAGNVDVLLVANLSRLGRDREKVNSYLYWLKDQFVDVVCVAGTVRLAGKS